jgi:opacity protein-like surface antigen
MTRLSVVAVLSCVCLVALAAQAQKNELAGEISGAFPSANNLNFNAAVGYQVNYAHRLFKVPGAGLYVEVPFLAGFSNQRTLNSLLNGQNYNSLYFTPGLELKLLPEFFISPYLAGGIGVAHFHSSTTSASENDFAGDIGGGLDVKVLPHVSLRGEVRDFITSTPGLNLGLLGQFTSLSGTTNNVVASGGVVIRF